MATLLSDNFDRANSATAVGSPQVGPAPTVPVGVGGISSNLLYGATSPANILWDLGTPNVELSAVFSSFSSTNAISFLLGYVNATTFWQVSVKNSNPYIELIRQEGGSFFTAASAPGTTVVPAGTNVKALYKDGVIRVYVEGQQVIRWAVDPITATLHGIRTGSTTVRVDNILGVDATVGMEATTTGSISEFVKTLNAVDVSSPAFLYKGRDTKVQDQTAGA